ncbi:MAG: right-handed parallel beta-helix repeat-containing protein, partial [Bacteroidetes bacterium]|nr:right-handed parallel beta-helix repeat-containing protein [Bacteroidota bacterium]
EVTNFGLASLTSFNVSGYITNGTTITSFGPVAYTGSAIATSGTATVTLGSFNFAMDPYTLVAWPSSPNGQTDDQPLNDTLFTSICVPLSGSFTIGTGGNFADMESAIDRLNCAGVGGPVSFSVIQGSGPFVGGLDIGNIPGTSATNTVVFQGNGSIINEGSKNYILAFDGASRVTFVDFKFINSDPNNNIFGIMIRGGSQHLNFFSNYIDVGMVSTSSLTAGIAVSNSTTSATSAGDNGSNLNIINNEIVGGYYGITLYRQSSYQNCTGNNVSNNIVRDFRLGGIYMSNVDTVLIQGNDIHRINRGNHTTFYGIYMTSSRNAKVLKNRIHDAGVGTYTAYPVYVSTSVNSLGYETEFTNNAIYNIETTGTIYGMYLIGSRDWVNVYHNTIHLGSSGTGARRGIFFSGAPNNHNVLNNIISIDGNNTGIKYCIYSSATSTSFASNNNVLYMGATAGTNHVGYWSGNQSSLPDWRTATSQDLASMDSDPVFASVSTGAITPLSSAIDNIGSASVGVLTDINSATRSNVTPDAGAVEFVGLPGDIALESAILDRSAVCYNPNDTVIVTIKNLFGGTVDFSVNPLTAAWSVTGPANSSGTILVNTGTLAVGATLDLEAYTVNMTQPGIYTLNAYIIGNAVNASPLNDTLEVAFEYEVRSILAVAPKVTTLTSTNGTAVINATSPLFPGGAFFMTEICHFRGSSTGSPTGGWPSYLSADDYIEITG